MWYLLASVSTANRSHRYIMRHSVSVWLLFKMHFSLTSWRLYAISIPCFNCGCLLFEDTNSDYITAATENNVYSYSIIYYYTPLGCGISCKELRYPPAVARQFNCRNRWLLWVCLLPYSFYQMKHGIVLLQNHHELWNHSLSICPASNKHNYHYSWWNHFCSSQCEIFWTLLSLGIIVHACRNHFKNFKWMV